MDKTIGRFKLFHCLLIVGTLVELVGFAYDANWHIHHPSLMPITPRTMLGVHSGIYVGLLIILLTSVFALARARVTEQSRVGLWVCVAGGAIAIVGNSTDMWAHGHGYEKGIYHDLMYLGAAVMLAGYIVVELSRIRESRIAEGYGIPAEAGQTPAGRSPVDHVDPKT